MVTRNDSLWKSLDWVTICIYLLLIVGGWFSVCGASYDYGDRDFLDFSTRAGKQFVWIICSFGLGFVLLMLEDRMYDMFAYIIYIGMIILLIVTIFIAPDTKGSRSWLVMGPVSLQPAEFAKFATALALAKYINSYSFSIKKEKCALVLGFIILLPMLLIIGQRETGSALVYLAFFLVLYREGMPGVVLFSGVCAVIYFVVGIRFDEVFIADTPTPLGEFIVLLLIICRWYGVGIPQAVGTCPEYYRRKFDCLAYRLSDIRILDPFQSGLGAVGALCRCGRLFDLLGIERASALLFPDCFILNRLHWILIFQ